MDHEQCEACGFDGARYDDDALIRELRELGPRWRALLDSAGSDLRTRPTTGVWSALEYAAHSRDITALHAFGVDQALTVDEPTYPQIGDDLIGAAAATYGDADPDEVVRTLDVEATRMARQAEDARGDAWLRGLVIGDARLDVRRLLEHALHDSLHHLADVRRGLSLLGAAVAE